MFEAIIKEYDSKKCVLLLISKPAGLFSSQQYYEVRIYTTKPRTTLALEDKYNDLAKKIIAKKEDWQTLPNDKTYTHTVKLDTYKDINIKLKKTKKNDAA